MNTVPLKEVADIERQGVSPEQISSGTNYLGLEHIESGGRICGSQVVEAGELASTKFRFDRNHVLFGKLRPYLAKIAMPDFDGVCSTDILPIRPGPDLDKRYLTYFLRQPSIVDLAASRSTGANLPRLSPKALGEMGIPWRPLPEQERIAAILDQADALRRLRSQSLARLSELGQAIFVEMFGSPAENPYQFKRASLGEIIQFKGGSQPPKSTFTYEEAPGRVRLVQIRDFRTDKYKTYVPAELAKRPFTEKDVMVGRYGPPVFQIFRGLSGTYNVALMKAKPVEGITEDFVFYLLQEPNLHGHIVANSERTAGQSGVNLELLEKYPAYFPPKDRLSAFSERLSLVDKMTADFERALREADALFSSLQSRAFRGEL